MLPDSRPPEHTELRKEFPPSHVATKLALWDWLFGTARLPGRKPGAYGLKEIDFPRNYLRQHLFAFRPFRGDVYIDR